VCGVGEVGSTGSRTSIGSTGAPPSGPIGACACTCAFACTCSFACCCCCGSVGAAIGVAWVRALRYGKIKPLRQRSLQCWWGMEKSSRCRYGAGRGRVMRTARVHRVLRTVIPHLVVMLRPKGSSSSSSSSSSTAALCQAVQSLRASSSPRADATVSHDSRAAVLRGSSIARRAGSSEE
jgi:hypothetical protein